jgi:hypothetical protein
MKVQLKPYEIYRGIPVYLYLEEQVQVEEYGAVIEWYGSLEEVPVANWKWPTRENVVQAARRLIDLLKATETSGRGESNA